MTKTIDTLVDDIKALLVNREGGIDDGVFEHFGNSTRDLMKYRFLSEKGEGPSLRMSNIGSPCARKLWFQLNQPQEAEPFDGPTLLKFLYGDMIEELLLFLAEAAGHKVTGRQTEQEIQGIKGHRDAIIDGMLIDVKSVSSYAFRKHLDNGLTKDDPFGYLAQINSYHYASKDDPELTDHDNVGFLVMDKVSGDIHLDVYPVMKDWDIEASYKNRIAVMSDTEEIPVREFEPEPEGSSGNMKLGMFCTYCNVKNLCYPNLRTFKYSRGPVYLTEVVKEPKVEEIT